MIFLYRWLVLMHSKSVCSFKQRYLRYDIVNSVQLKIKYILCYYIFFIYQFPYILLSLLNNSLTSLSNSTRNAYSHKPLQHTFRHFKLRMSFFLSTKHPHQSAEEGITDLSSPLAYKIMLTYQTHVLPKACKTILAHTHNFFHTKFSISCLNNSIMHGAKHKSTSQVGYGWGPVNEADN